MNEETSEITSSEIASILSQKKAKKRSKGSKKDPKKDPKGPKGDQKNELNELQKQILGLDIVIIHRLICGNCKAVINEFTMTDIINQVQLVNIDTENWGIYYSYLPPGSLSLPIIISKKTKKISLGRITLDNLLSKIL